MRGRVVQVRLTDEELSRLDARVDRLGSSRSAVLRGAIDEPSPPPAVPTLPARQHALALRTRAAVGGSVAAAVALERALRLAPVAPSPSVRPGPVNLDDIPVGGLRVVR